MKIKKSHEHLLDGRPFLVPLKEAADEADMLLSTLDEYFANNDGPDLYEIDGERYVTREALHSWLSMIEASLVERPV